MFPEENMGKWDVATWLKFILVFSQVGLLTLSQVAVVIILLYDLTLKISLESTNLQRRKKWIKNSMSVIVLYS